VLWRVFGGGGGGVWGGRGGAGLLSFFSVFGLAFEGGVQKKRRSMSRTGPSLNFSRAENQQSIPTPPTLTEGESGEKD